jgi:hypothetical protein
VFESEVEREPGPPRTSSRVQFAECFVFGELPPVRLELALGQLTHVGSEEELEQSKVS